MYVCLHKRICDYLLLHKVVSKNISVVVLGGENIFKAHVKIYLSGYNRRKPFYGRTIIIPP